MKPARFAYEAPSSLEQACALLVEEPGARLMAGAQTLGPMLNLRLVQPALVVDITRIPALVRVEDEPRALLYGACITHAALEDGRVPDATGGALARVASGIAYRAVRNRGTLGGSLAHADPAADWLSALAALEAEVIVFDGHSRRRIAVARLATSALETTLAAHEIIEAVRVPRRSPAARFGYWKLCRKTGEFAEAIGAVLLDPEQGTCRAVIGATDGVPVVVEQAGALGIGGTLDRAAVDDLLVRHGIEDPYARQIHFTALARAAQQVSA